MRICIITSIFPPDVGGPAIYARELLERLTRRGHTVKVVTTSRSAHNEPNVCVVRSRSKSARNPILQLALTLYSGLEPLFCIMKVSKECDLLYVQNVSLLVKSFLASRLSRKALVLKFVGDFAWETAYSRRQTRKNLEDFLDSPQGRINTKRLIAVQKFLLNRVNRIIVPSEFLKEVLVKYYKVEPDKIRVVYNSVNLPIHQSQTEYRQSSGKPCLITIGRLIQHKRIDGIIKAVKELAGEFPGINLLVVGEGPEQSSLEKLSQELGIESRVKFYGRASHQETIELLQGADIFILNSVYEGLPHVVIEAMACRVPVVATNIRGTDEVVTDGETGLLVSPNSNDELKNKLVWLLKDAELRNRLVESAYRSVQEKFTWERNLEILEREIEGVL